jgi:EAL domain-containing protein (putative c-di-GMP-specific phosphodiesterase class I)
MKIDQHSIIYKAAQTKFDVIAGSIVGENDLFTLTSEDGRIFTQDDFTSIELTEAEKTIESDLAQAKAEAEARKSSAIAKLAALGLDLDDLKSLGF